MERGGTEIRGGHKENSGSGAKMALQLAENIVAAREDSSHSQYERARIRKTFGGSGTPSGAFQPFGLFLFVCIRGPGSLGPYYVKMVSKILPSFSVACLENMPTMPEIAAMPNGLMV